MAADRPAGALYAGGTILTLGPTQPRVAALATHGDRILAVGSETSCRAALRRARVVAVDEVRLHGACVVQGFIDTHLHPLALLYFDMNADLRGVDSIAAVQHLQNPRATRQTA